jgi:phage shock protein E
MKTKFIGLFLITIFLSSSFAFAQQAVNLYPQEFINKIKTTKNAQLLDVRTPQEWADGKVASSICINYMESDFKQKVTKLDKNKPIFVYCAAGGRSPKAAKILADAGFKQVYNLTSGGYADLAKAGIK